MICSGLAYAGSAYIYEMANPTDVGYASAGLAARAGDAGTVFANPAGMTRFENSTYLAGITPLYINAAFDSDENTTATGPDKGVHEFSQRRLIRRYPSCGGQTETRYQRPELLWSGARLGGQMGRPLRSHQDGLNRAPAATNRRLQGDQLRLSIGAGAGLTLGVLADEAKVNNLDPNLGDGKLKYDDTDFAVPGQFRGHDRTLR